MAETIVLCAACDHITQIATAKETLACAHTEFKRANNSKDVLRVKCEVQIARSKLQSISAENKITYSAVADHSRHTAKAAVAKKALTEIYAKFKTANSAEDVLRMKAAVMTARHKLAALTAMTHQLAVQSSTEFTEFKYLDTLRTMRTDRAGASEACASSLNTNKAAVEEQLTLAYKEFRNSNSKFAIAAARRKVLCARGQLGMNRSSCEPAKCGPGECGLEEPPSEDYSEEDFEEEDYSSGFEESEDDEGGKRAAHMENSCQT